MRQGVDHKGINIFYTRKMEENSRLLNNVLNKKETLRFLFQSYLIRFRKAIHLTLFFKDLVCSNLSISLTQQIKNVCVN